jgi:hypothetical protein
MNAMKAGVLPKVSNVAFEPTVKLETAAMKEVSYSIPDFKVSTMPPSPLKTMTPRTSGRLRNLFRISLSMGVPLSVGAWSDITSVIKTTWISVDQAPGYFIFPEDGRLSVI